MGEIERYREIEGRGIETEKQRDRANNTNPKQSWVAQLVIHIFTLAEMHQEGF
jgi:hypothetical protein